MAQNASDVRFHGSVAELYEQLMVPMIFEPYAQDIASRAVLLAPREVLETAAGTGAVTRALARALPADVSLTATDLNPPMIERAQRTGTSRLVHWQAADAMQLPFDDQRFDLVVCQFGAMFFPDKAQAYGEARRVLKPGGTFLFNVWDRIEENEIPCEVMQALASACPDDPPRFITRTPHGYFDLEQIARDLAAGGFDAEPRFETVTRISRAPSAEAAATAFCQGTPMRGEIEARPGLGLARATAAAADALRQRFGSGPIEGRIQAHVVAVRRS